MCTFVTRLLLIAAIAAATTMTGWPQGGIDRVLADDDGGGDDGGDDGDDGDDGAGPSSPGGGERSSRRLNPRVQPRPPAAPATLPERVDNEIVVLGVEVEDFGRLAGLGYILRETRELASADTWAVRLVAPPGRDLEAARAEIAATVPGAATDFNHFYRSEGARNCTAPHCTQLLMVGWPSPAQPWALPAGCDPGGLIAMIDTGVDLSHAALDPGRIEAISLAAPELVASGLQHGTAVAALLVGNPAGPNPGLLPHARLLAIDAFHTAGRDERTDAFSLLRGLDLASSRRVQVVNLSLAGPSNEALSKMVDEMVRDGLVLVAAAGNGGPAAAPAFPAAHPAVIAVTAVDSRGQAYRRAGRGSHIDIAAPGVDVWTASALRGGQLRTGTSFAAPFVAAASYLHLQVETSATEAIARLRTEARDLGPVGPDHTFGAGLLNAAGVCPP